MPGVGMILSAHQPAYLPWLGYLHRIAVSDHFVILDHVQFEKNSFSNRNRINLGGKETWLTVPVHLKGHMLSTIRDIHIVQNTTWAKKHLKSIIQAYHKCPFFDQHKDFFESVYSKKWRFLYDLNHALLLYLFDQFAIKTPLTMLSAIPLESKKQDLILDLCQIFSAKTFLFGPNGLNYVDKNKFRAKGIKPVFYKYQTPLYKNFSNVFIPNLSCIDLLFNYPTDELPEFLMAGAEELR